MLLEMSKVIHLNIFVCISQVLKNVKAIMNERTKVEVFAMDFGKRYAWIHLYSDQHTKIAADSLTCFSTENNGKHLLNMYFLSSFIFLIYLLRGAMVEW